MPLETITAREREALHLLAQERLRTSLLAAISHDLRTPLTALACMAESLALAEASPSSCSARSAQKIREAVSRMSSRVNSLLDMTRLLSGRGDLERQWLPLEEAIGSALRTLEGALDARRVRITLPDLPLLHVNPTLFDRVLCNLLENATKYTPQDSPIEISAETAGDQVRIFIDDHGPGLAKHREEAIFQMFERDCDERSKPGVGLGLAICRAIVEAHSGTITGESRPDGGARFTITLPRRQSPIIDAGGDLDQ